VAAKAVVSVCRKLVVLENERRENSEQIIAIYHSIVRFFRLSAATHSD
jgi:hypothetical protein